MKAAIMSAARKVRDKVSRRGLDVRTVRGREYWRAGVEVLWHPFDRRTERTYICHIESFGAGAVFLVRDKRDYLQSHWLSGHFYAEDELRVIQQHYRGGTFLDIGANAGNHSIFAATVLKAPKVIAVEPNPDAYRILRCNIALNDAAIEHVAAGLSDHSGRGSIKLEIEGNLGLATVVDDASGNIRIVAGDDLFLDEEIGFIKLDVEGLEMEVLDGLQKVIDRYRPPLMIEVMDTNIPAFRHFEERFGYREVWTAAPYRNQTYFMALTDTP